MLLTVVAPILLTLTDVSIIPCEAEWMDSKRLEQMVGAELNELDLSEKQDEVWIMDQCTNGSARIRELGGNGQRERMVSLAGIPPELKLRTVVLALGDLAREPASQSPEESNEASQIEQAPPYKNEQGTAVGAAAPLTQPARQPETSSSPPKPVAEEKRPPDDTAAKAVPPLSNRIEVNADFRWFPLTDTYTPEARIGLRTEKWRLSIGGYGMRWKSGIGKTYLTAISAFVGPTLWQTRGAVDVGLDALMELGGAFVIADASVDVETSPRFNVLAGAHLSLWVNPLPSKKVQMLLFAQAGWLRGVNVYAGTVFQGGFEGLSTAFGAAISR